jgi:alkylated DNA repair dioxygenase AlkB
MKTIHLADGGVLSFAADFYPPRQAVEIFQMLKKKADWKQEKARTGHLFPRLTAWYADEGISYTYSGVTHPPMPWPAFLLPIKQRVEQAADHVFNSLLLNYYRHGKDSLGFHADDEPELGTNPVIASLSLGATRKFILRHNRTREKLTLDLSDGSLLIMAGTTQHFYQHAIPKTAAPVGERINLTFRKTYPRER